MITLVQQGQIPQQWVQEVESLAQLGQNLGRDIHIQTDYGDKLHGLTPWELFDEEDAREALRMAREVVGRTKALIQTVGGTDEV